MSEEEYYSPEFQAMLKEQRLKFYMPMFLGDIDKFNAMYKMPEVGNDLIMMVKRLEDFRSILDEECRELTDIQMSGNESQNVEEVKRDMRVQLSDLLGDIIVYCASEAKRWGIPIDQVLSIIMDSNFSKLDANGQPIYDERMKLLKGPNYWNPEPKIAQLLKDAAS